MWELICFVVLFALLGALDLWATSRYGDGDWPGHFN